MYERKGDVECWDSALVDDAESEVESEGRENAVSGTKKMRKKTENA